MLKFSEPAFCSWHLDENKLIYLFIYLLRLMGLNLWESIKTPNKDRN